MTHSHHSGPHWIAAVAIAVLAAVLLWQPWGAHRESTLPAPVEHIVAGTVARIISEEFAPRLAGSRTDRIQELAVDLDDGRAVRIHNDLTPLEEGDGIYVNISLPGTEDESFSIVDVQRSGGLVKLAALFAVLVIAIARRKGVYALIGLAFSVGVVFAFLVPGIIAGWDPALAALATAALIAAVTIYLGHGITRTSVAALTGIVATLGLAALIGTLAVGALDFTGYGDESVLYLNAETGNTLDLVGLAVAGIIIAAIGVLDDVAVTQASAVFELAAASAVRGRELFRRAMRVGTDHISAVVNTLALAYIGAALPLVLLLYISDFPFAFTIGGEPVAEEIVRTLASSIGLVLAAPLTTAAAVWLSRKD